MPKIIRTHETNLDLLSDFDRSQIYNGLDTLVTHDVFAAIYPQLDDTTAATYAFSRALQAPTLEMRIRGVLIDQVRRSEVIEELTNQSDILEQRLNHLVLEGVGLPGFNYRSHDHLRDLFYNRLGIHPILKLGRPTTDRGAREKLAVYTIATALVNLINVLTEIGDRISVLRTALDPDGRIRTSYNIAGTSTGRFSSSLSEFGTGGNLQNIEESLRSVLIADPGYKFAKADAKSGESYCVGAIEWNRFNDGTYLDAVESGDIHTSVARLVWPDLGWTGQLQTDRRTAEQPFYRGHSYRFMCKKLGHGSNYNGKPFTLAEQSKLPIDIVANFQPQYFRAFPAHRRWQADVEHRLRESGTLTTLTGRKRWFFGRRTDASTLREAIAYDPQGSLADIVNLALLRIWRERRVAIVMHDHDALTAMYPEETEDEIVAYLQRALPQPVPLDHGRAMTIPYDIEVGWNKGHYHPTTNPDGLREYTPGDHGRRRQPIRNMLQHVLGTR